MLLLAGCNPWSTDETDYRSLLEDNPVAGYYIGQCRRVQQFDRVILANLFWTALAVSTNANGTIQAQRNAVAEKKSISSCGV